MKSFHQLVHTLSYGDAISTEVLSLQRCLREQGMNSDVYAINVHPKLKGQAIDYREFEGRNGKSYCGGIVLHYSLGSPLNALYNSLNQAERALIYHNLTPPHWFKSVNPEIVSNIEKGYEELPQLCRITDRLWADSKFNANELDRLGFKAEVLELPVDPERWNITTNLGIASLLQNDGWVNFLHVGRIAPNKCIEDIIKIFYFYHHHINRNSRLWLVGIDTDTELYSFSLKRLVYELSLDHVVQFCGCMDDGEVRALYENSSIYLCMSEHEGFCLPVVEAMHFGLPVISYASSALPDTIADGGILVHEKRHAEIAELANMLLSDNALRARLVDAGKKRVKCLSYERFTENVRILLNSVSAANSIRVAEGA